MIQLSSCSSVVPCHAPWLPLIDVFVDDAVLQFSPDRDEALH